MFIESLQLSNFRSYTKKTVSFPRGTTLLVGPNGIGKTNILEAIFMLATAGSFRAEHDHDVVNWDTEVATVSARIAKEDELILLTMVVTRGIVSGQSVPVKKYQINSVLKRMVDFVGNIRVVLFWPEDLLLITGSPSRRRQYLDSVLIQVDREYRRSLNSYERGLRQRNKLLRHIKEGTASRSQLLFWDQLLIKSGQYITAKREAFINFIDGKDWIPDQKHHFSITYDASTISETRLAQYEREEVAAQVTLVGPHRDDIKFSINTEKKKIRDLASFGSRGEQRLGVLWLKLAQLAYIEQVSGEKSILLLDDIFSELDSEHRDVVYKLCEGQQTIITSADPHTIPNQYKAGMNVVELE